jgi:hypothetical protein
MSQDFNASYLPLEDVPQDSADQVRETDPLSDLTHLSLSYNHFSVNKEVSMPESRSELGLFTTSELSAMGIDLPIEEGYERILLVEEWDDPDLFEVKQRIKYLKQPHVDENVFKVMLFADVVSFFLLAITSIEAAGNTDHFNLVVLTAFTFSFILADCALIKLNIRADNYEGTKELASLEKKVAKKYITSEYWKKGSVAIGTHVEAHGSSNQFNTL